MRLLILRHAKSDWSDPTQDDHDRKLNTRGRAAATKLGHWITEQGYAPDEILCSTAARTRETVALMGLKAAVSLNSALYLASAETLLHEVRRASGKTIMVVAHNPGIASFASRILRAPPVHPRFQDYPTAALTVAHIALTDWQNVQPSTADIEAFIVPSDIQ